VNPGSESTVGEPAAAQDETLARTEAALQEALAERNRLWEELQQRKAVEADLAFWRAKAEGYERSRWWKLGLPLRVAKRVLEDPPGTLDIIAHDLRQRRRSR
jgi:hypothetical protein